LNNPEAYDKVSERFLAERAQAEVPELVETLAGLLEPGASVLDLGCGGGLPVTSFLASRGFKVTGLDLSIRLLEHARTALPQVHFFHGDIARFKSSEKFSAVVAWDSLFHLERHQHGAVFDKVHAILKVPGYFLFTHGGREGQIQGEMFGQTFSYSSPGPEKIRLHCDGLGFGCLRWELDPSDGKGYLRALLKKDDV
jgi:SAM-dependent methyltransferase